MEQMTLNLPGVDLEEEVIKKELSFEEKIEQSKKILKLGAAMSKKFYGAPMMLCYSGGKDSEVLLHLAETTLEIGDFEVVNSHTSVDAPETVYIIRDTFKRLNEKGIHAEVLYPKDANGNHETMWTLIPKKKSPPTRLIRHCCQKLKEISTPNRMACIGVRADESTGRKGRDVFGVRGSTKKEGLFFSLEHTEEVFKDALEMDDPVWDCTLIKNMREHKDTLVYPIYDWSNKEIWDYIHANNLTINPLYNRGYLRIGCIGCPMASYKQKMKEFNEYPTYKQAYINAFQKMLDLFDDEERRKNQSWKTGEDVFDWWIQEGKHNVKGQINMFDEE